MKHSILFAALSIASLSAAYVGDDFEFSIRDIDFDSYLNARNLDTAKILPRASAAKGNAIPPQRLAGSSGLGPSRLPLPAAKTGEGYGPRPQRHQIPSPSGQKVSKIASSAKEFALGGPTSGSRMGRASFLGSSGKSQFLSKFGLGKTSDKPTSSLVKPTKEEHRQYLTRPASSPGQSSGSGSPKAGSSPQSQASEGDYSSTR